MDRPSTPSRKPARQAFTLVEVVVALGIVAAGLLPLLGLLVYGVQQASESRQESIAAQISDSIFTNLRQSSGWLAGGSGGILIQKSSNYPETATNPNNDFARYSPPAATASYYLAYGYDPTGFEDLDFVGIRAIEPLTSGDYSTGYFSSTSTGMTTTHIVRVTFTKETLTNGAQLYTPRLYRVEVSAETPAAAPEAERKKYLFTAYMNLTDQM